MAGIRHGKEGKGMHSSWLAYPLSLNGGIRQAKIRLGEQYLGG